MTTLFDKCFTYTMGMEGGEKFTNDQDDPGGATKYGISLRFLKGITEGDIDHDGDIDADDVKGLSWTSAKYLYEKHFWHPSFENLHPQLASKLFDLRVNMGPVQATKILQEALNRNGEQLVVDGNLGPMTLDGVIRPLGGNAVVIYEIQSTAARFYFNLADKRPASQKYLLGWLRRTYSVLP